MLAVLPHGPPPLRGSVIIRVFRPQMPGVPSSVETDVLADDFIQLLYVSGFHLAAYSNHLEEYKTQATPQNQPNLKTRAPFTKEGKCVKHLGILTPK